MASATQKTSSGSDRIELWISGALVEFGAGASVVRVQVTKPSTLIKGLHADDTLPAWAAAGFRTTNCRQIRVTWSSDRKDVPAYVHSLLSDVGQVEHIEDIHELAGAGTPHRQTITFAEDGVAEVAAKDYGRRQEFLDGNKLGVEVWSRVEIQIPFAGYQAIESQLTELIDSWKHDAETSALEVDTTLPKKYLANGEVALHTKRHGDTHGDRSPCGKSLPDSGVLNSFVLINIAGSSKKTLKKAAASLQTVVDTISIQCDETIDLSPSYRQIEEANAQVRTAVEDDAKCSGCGDSPEKPTFLQCSHVYCLECLEHLCRSSPSMASFTQIECQTCSKVPGLDELQHALPRTTFEAVLQASFTAHVRRIVKEYGHCATPDCDHLYAKMKAEDPQDQIGPNERAPAIACDQCLEVTCLRCDRQHAGMTCAVFDYETSEEQQILQDYKKQLGFKDCRNCGTTIEKTFGCNHMACSGCNAHICWVCLEVFSSAIECMNHLEAYQRSPEHGNGPVDEEDTDEEDADEEDADEEDADEEDADEEDEEDEGEDENGVEVDDMIPEGVDWRTARGWSPADWTPVPHIGGWN